MNSMIHVFWVSNSTTFVFGIIMTGVTMILTFISMLTIYKLIYRALFVFQMMSSDVVVNDSILLKEFKNFYQQKNKLFSNYF